LVETEVICEAPEDEARRGADADELPRRTRTTVSARVPGPKLGELAAECIGEAKRTRAHGLRADVDDVDDVDTPP
jgi:hypothetical protein